MARPKNKFQKEIVSLSKKLPKLTKTFKKHVINSFAKYYVIKYNNSYCTECGNIIHDNSSQIYCNNCETLLEFVDINSAVHVTSIYHTILVNFKGWQVVRQVYASKKINRKGSPKYHIRETSQTWIREDGKHDALSLKVSHSYHYIDIWSFSSKLEPRTESPRHYSRIDINGYIYKKISLIPKLKRNGYLPEFHKDRDVSITKSIIALLKVPMMETLFKARQYSLFMEYFNHGLQVIEAWPSIKIAIRNKYTIFSANIWLDYLSDLERLNRDLLNPHYICPDNLQKTHTLSNAKVREINKRERYLEQIENIRKEEPIYKENRKNFFDISIKNDEVIIEPIKTVQDVYDISEELNFCLFTNNYHTKSDSLLLAAKINGLTLEVIEVSIKHHKILQARGKGNTPTTNHDKIVESVNQNMNLIKQIR